MRREIFAVPNLLLCGALVLLAPGLHAEIVTGANPPNIYNAANQTAVADLNQAYAYGRISYQEYEARLLQLEKSVNVDSNYNRTSQQRSDALASKSTKETLSSITLNAPLLAGPTYLGPTSVTANWLANGDPSGTLYQVQISADPSFNSGTIELATAGFSVSFTGLVPNTNYYMRVRAVDDSGNSTAYIALPSVTTLPASSGGPISVSTLDRGVYAGNHYWEIYWALPPGYTCISATTLVSHGPSNLAVYLAPPSSSQVSESYAGPSGFSPNVCQVNVYAPTGTPLTALQFNYNSYVDTHIESEKVSAGSLSLSF